MTGVGSYPKKILLVDDEPNILLPLQYLMKQGGYEVYTAADGEEALLFLQHTQPDLMLLDVTMPRRSGYEVCEAVRANPAWQGVRVIMLSAEGRGLDREKGLALGADDYITKPFSTKQLLQRVQELIG